MRIFVAGAVTKQALRSVVAGKVVPTSVSFSPPKPRPEVKRVIVDDLGVPAKRRHQNVRRGFWGER